MRSPGLLARRLGRAAVDFVFPPRCAVCGIDGSLLCDACAALLQPADGPRCPRCWRPGRFAGTCGPCLEAPPAFDSLRAAFVYEGPARELVHALKYRGEFALAEPMSRLLAHDATAHAVDLIVPVPLAGMRKRTRGFNQAEALARGLGKALGLPVRPRALRRRRHGPPQARSSDAAERRRNVAGAFESREAEVAGLDVLVLDDVTTTGATLDACAAALRAANARSIHALAFARED